MDETEGERGRDDDHDQHELQHAVEPQRRANPIGDPTAHTLPIAIPPKKPVRMRETAWVVLPNTSTSWRDQTIS